MSRNLGTITFRFQGVWVSVYACELGGWVSETYLPTGLPCASFNVSMDGTSKLYIHTDGYFTHYRPNNLPKIPKNF